MTTMPATTGKPARRGLLRHGRRLLERTHDRMFRRIHTGNLIYNACWEDPRLDREALGLDGESRVAMITSAGCNALDYLLDGPREIHCIDVNSRQNALLELKLALLRHADFATLFHCFGEGRHARFADVYAGLRDHLTADGREFWDGHRYYFGRPRLRRSFYYHGAAGKVAWMVRQMLRARPSLHRNVLRLLQAESLAEQGRIFDRIEPDLWNPLLRGMMRQPLTLALLGVPRAQIELIRQGHADGVTGFVMARLRHLCTEVPMAENYFWRVYVTGEYTLECCPNYLRGENFAVLRERAGRIRPWTGTLSAFLEMHPGRYTHFVLLDHQDWLAEHDPDALVEEWALILANAAPGAKILMRSAGERIDFVPDAALACLEFDHALAAALHRRDRVGTYGSFHVATVRP
jgi:S-adenosylmethionine-diacylglycerol 3-amino-3-carboxypropyl transferase